MKSETEAEAFYAIMPEKTAGEEKPKALPAPPDALARHGVHRAPRRASCDTRRSFLRGRLRAGCSATRCVHTGARVWKLNWPRTSVWMLILVVAKAAVERGVSTQESAESLAFSSAVMPSFAGFT